MQKAVKFPFKEEEKCPFCRKSIYCHNYIYISVEWWTLCQLSQSWNVFLKSLRFCSGQCFTAFECLLKAPIREKKSSYLFPFYKFKICQVVSCISFFFLKNKNNQFSFALIFTIRSSLQSCHLFDNKCLFLCFSSFSPLSHITLRFRFIVLSRLSFLHFSSNNFYFIPILTSVTKHVQTDLQLTPNCCPVLFSQFLENSSSIIEIAAIRHISHNRPKSDLTFRYVRIGGAK